MVEIGRGRTARRTYGFDDVALVPGAVTLDPEVVDLSCDLAGISLALPVLASAMDAVVDVNSAAVLTELGGLAVLHLEGVQCRYEDPAPVLDRIASASTEEALSVIQEAYREPVKDDLILRRVTELREKGAKVAVSPTPITAHHAAEIIGAGKIDALVVASTVTTARHISSRYESPDFRRLADLVQAPVFVGNCVSYRAALDLMRAGADAVLVGVGPGAACTTRRVLGIGVPQVTAAADCAAARDDYRRETGKRVPVILDGGMRVGGDIAKAIASGADAVMIGSPLAAAEEAPGRGYHWGMATSAIGLPRGTRIKVGTAGPMKQILLGPAKRDDGTMNLFGALRLSMACCGARTLADMQRTEIVVAHALPTEGKAVQRAQGVGGAR
ncbi:MAG TPA: GuaB3 family IMP dehydrogenase-related protein [Armatimonadota bacterium]|nr:GuaB3 family IMP dehydrogenase-related protein [Armatimonadota bacterium]